MGYLIGSTLLETFSHFTNLTERSQDMLFTILSEDGKIWQC